MDITAELSTALLGGFAMVVGIGVSVMILTWFWAHASRWFMP